MKRNLCLLPTRHLGTQYLIYIGDDAKFITSDIDDDSSAISKSFDIVREKFSINQSLLSMNCFNYLGEIEHNNELFSIVQFVFPKNFTWEYDKKLRPAIGFTFDDGEFMGLPGTNPKFNFNDSFVLAIGFRILTY